MTQLFRDVEGKPLCPGGSVVCIGAFDGLHRGHQALVGHARDRARELSLPAVALSFEPLPREYFSRQQPPARLLLPRAKFEGLRALGMDLVGLLRFNTDLVAMSAEDFIGQLLLERLSAREIWVGPDFRFGNGRRGDVAMLRRVGSGRGLAVQEIAPVLVDGERVSSSRLREHLACGDLKAAEGDLGWRYAIAGKVVRGPQLGRTLGYPTANIRVGRKPPALSGIFATWVHGVGDTPRASVSSLGTRPTVQGKEPLLEAHLFDFDGDLYGQRIEVEFVAKLRDEVKFDNLPAMVVQMDIDSRQARRALRLDTQECGALA